MEELNGWQGRFDIFIKSKNGDWQYDRTINNLITDGGLDLLRNLLQGTATDGQIKYIAVGTSSVAVASTQTQLGAEVFRKPVLTRTALTTGSLQSVTILTETEAVASIQEIGIFAGSTASTASNSGVMISRILYSRNKTNLESIQIQRTDTIARG
jgi:hypothetical protein